MELVLERQAMRAENAAFPLHPSSNELKPRVQPKAPPPGQTSPVKGAKRPRTTRREARVILFHPGLIMPVQGIFIEAAEVYRSTMRHCLTFTRIRCRANRQYILTQQYLDQSLRLYLLIPLLRSDGKYELYTYPDHLWANSPGILYIVLLLTRVQSN
ncbi:uncharacterized protein BO97DRAFT_189389 [Aspergillus homomorphus CBS 101889]|uniref:Uncharacterized protein n=1 Tax=Aspergillus homomorphus (strain CBS 101889) TaxID=1450537 RepID=A0A395HMT3_ASPHC|nr:hypothetical protein BO97DRAFT_189389 [Aspergillus homomorphus CBS 101889]RAL09070.1 hypothetical protein BO97DRAFT_189389 [Aspergillus homomorphus CBS 101889]